MNSMLDREMKGLPPLDRRQFLGCAATAAGTGLLAGALPAWAEDPPAASATTGANQRYKIGVCDWMILKRQKLGAFALAKEIGVDGVEVDMGSLGQRDTFESSLADPSVRRQFLDTARDLDLSICSLAMSGFYAQSFAERTTVPRMVQDCIDTMQQMNVQVAFLPLGVRSDLVLHPELRPAVVKRLKSLAPHAEQAGVVLGLETALDAAGEVKLLEDIGSPSVKIYYNFAKALQNGRDLEAELRTLGKDRICQIHATDQDGVWLENDPKIDMPRIKQTLDELGWSGWLVLERSRDARDARNVRKNYGANAAYLKKVFQGV
jgi:sugar phosphate isomerase/epimerase